MNRYMFDELSAFHDKQIVSYLASVLGEMGSVGSIRTPTSGYELGFTSIEVFRYQLI